MICAAIIFSSLYLGVCFYLSRGLGKIIRQKNCEKFIENKAQRRVSVIVCARNEEENIGKLLDCLLRQTYPKDKTQIIVADDRSYDKTSEIALSYKDKFDDFLLINIQNEQTQTAPKKFAFTQAIRRAAGEIIVQTDADSVVSPDWIEKLIAPFANDEISLVQGVVKYRFEKSAFFFLKTYQELDFLSHGIVAAAGIGKNIPLNANANNFAFRKETYDALGGYGTFDEAVGGDDGLLMQKVWQSGKKIFFNADCAVGTKPEYSWKNLINQRKKWGSETRFYLPKQTAILVSIFAFYCFTIFAFIAIFINPRNLAFIPALLGIKIFGELLFMYEGLLLFGEKNLLFHIIWVSPINLFINAFSVFSGVFTKFDWKGDKFGAKVKRKRKENL